MRKSTKPEAMKVPAGYREIAGSRSDVWTPKAVGEFIEGVVTEVKAVKTKKGKKTIESRLMTLAGDTGANAVWMSAALQQALGKEKVLIGRQFMIVYEGLQRIKGQGNPMKRFRVFEKETKATPKAKK
jgi:hypothetical protein